MASSSALVEQPKLLDVAIVTPQLLSPELKAFETAIVFTLRRWMLPGAWTPDQDAQQRTAGYLSDRFHRLPTVDRRVGLNMVASMGQVATVNPALTTEFQSFATAVHDRCSSLISHA